METLPNEVLFKICNLLSPRDVFGELKFVSRRLYAFIDSAGDRFTHPRIPICYLQAHQCFTFDDQGQPYTQVLLFRRPNLIKDLARSRIGTLVIDGSLKKDLPSQYGALKAIYAERILFYWNRDDLHDARAYLSDTSWQPCSPMMARSTQQSVALDSDDDMLPKHSHNYCPAVDLTANHFYIRPRFDKPSPTWATWVLEHLKPPKQFGLLYKSDYETLYFLLPPASYSIRFSQLPVDASTLPGDLPVIPINIRTISQAIHFCKAFEDDALIHGQWRFNVQFGPATAFNFRQYAHHSKQIKLGESSAPIMYPIKHLPADHILIMPTRQRIDEHVHELIQKISSLLL